MGRDIYEILDQGTGDKIRETFEHVMNTGRPLEIEETYPNPDGTLGYYLSKKVPLKDKQGNVLGVGGISINISDRKEREQLEKELQKTKAYAEGQRDMALQLSHMASGIAHELRTPVTDGRLRTDFGKPYFQKTLEKYLSAQMLGLPGFEEWSPKVIAKLRKFFDDLSAIFINLNNIITYNLATISRAMAGELQFEDLQPCDFFKTFSKALEHFPFTEEQRKSFTGNVLLTFFSGKCSFVQFGGE